MSDDRPKLFERNLIDLLNQVLSADPDVESVLSDVSLGRGLRVDLVVERTSGAIDLMEVKNHAPLSWAALNSVGLRMREYDQAWGEIRGSRPRSLILVVPGHTLTRSKRLQLMRLGVQLWDRSNLQQRVADVSGHLLGPSASQAWDALFTDTRKVERQPGEASLHPFSSVLNTIDCGKTRWSSYQKACADILTYLFCPPLELPLYEDSNASGVNRRDLILPNYALDGFWRFLYQSYRAEYVVIDAKNHCGRINKPHILQLANYLSDAGTGLFGIILSRNEEGRGSLVTRREQWILHRKMILVLSDDDMHQMIQSKATGSAPEDVLRQKLQDFRLAI